MKNKIKNMKFRAVLEGEEWFYERHEVLRDTCITNTNWNLKINEWVNRLASYFNWNSYLIQLGIFNNKMNIQHEG